MKVKTKEMGLKEKYPTITGFTVMNGELLIFVTKNSCGLTGENYMKIKEIYENNCDMNIFNWGNLSMASSSFCLLRLKKIYFQVLKDNNDRCQIKKIK